MLRDSAKGTYFVAEVGEEVIGQLMITNEWSEWRNGTYWWIQSVYVEKSARGQGVFKSLYAHVVTEAKKQGDVRGVKLYVYSDNITAQRSYMSLGMQKTNYEIFERMF